MIDDFIKNLLQEYELEEANDDLGIDRNILSTIKLDPKLEGMVLRDRGSRLSVQPVSEKHFTYIREVLGKKGKG